MWNCILDYSGLLEAYLKKNSGEQEKYYIIHVWVG